MPGHLTHDRVVQLDTPLITGYSHEGDGLVYLKTCCSAN